MTLFSYELKHIERFSNLHQCTFKRKHNFSINSITKKILLKSQTRTKCIRIRDLVRSLYPGLRNAYGNTKAIVRIFPISIYERVYKVQINYVVCCIPNKTPPETYLRLCQRSMMESFVKTSLSQIPFKVLNTHVDSRIYKSELSLRRRELSSGFYPNLYFSYLKLQI